MAPLKLFRSAANDPLENLALEEALYRSMDEDERILLLYRNEESIIIGRNQNPWKESNYLALKQSSIPLYRRFSGGGCVYHDTGNLNFSYMTSRREFSRDFASTLVCRAVSSSAVPAEVNERGDILVRGKKCSGSAYRISGKTAYHHGTLLVRANLNSLGNLLHSPLTITEAKGTPSVPAQVVNLGDLDPDLSCDSAEQKIFQTFREYFGAASSMPESIDKDAERLKPQFNEVKKSLESRDWRVGKTPAFLLSLDFSPVFGIPLILEFQVKRGIITDISTIPADSPLLNSFLPFTGSPLSLKAMEQRLSRYSQDIIRELAKFIP